MPTVREMVERRTANSRHFMKADGSFLAEIHLQPIHFKAADSTWQPISTDLAPSSAPGFAYANETNSFKTYLPGSAPGWVRIRTPEGETFEFQAVGLVSGASEVSGSRLSLRGQGNAPALSYDVEPGLLKETITMPAKLASAAFSFAFRMDGLAPRLEWDDSVCLYGADGQPRLVLDAPFMEDSAGNRSREIDVTLAQDGNTYVYTLVPDPAWLAAARYPVVIDPTVRTVYPDWTACVEESSPTTTYTPGVQHTDGNGQTYMNLEVGANYYTGRVRSVLHFDGASLPKDADVVGAGLYLPWTAEDNNGFAVTLQASLLPKTLQSSQVTWNTVGSDVPDTPASPTYSLPVRTGPSPIGQQIMLNVTDIVDDYLGNGGFYDDQGQFATGLSILVHATDDVSYLAYTNRAYFGASTAYLGVTYNAGWYTLGGNRRRSGRTWSTLSTPMTVPTASGWPAGGLELTLPAGYDTSSTETKPSIAVVPTSNPAYRVIYAAVPGRDTVNDRYRTRVFRIEETATGLAVATCTLPPDPVPPAQMGPGFCAVGTPLVVNNKVIIAGNDSVSGTTGYVYALNNAGGANFYPVWPVANSRPRQLPGPTLGSPVHSYLPTKYTLQGAGTRWCYDGCVVLHAGDALVALSLLNGNNVWGTVANDGTGALAANVAYSHTYSDGRQLSGTSPGGLIPLYVPGTNHSSPSIDGDMAYIMDESCYLNARDLTTGGFPGQNGSLWDKKRYDDVVSCAPSIFDHTIFWGGDGYDIVASKETPDTTSSGYEWWLDDTYEPTLGAVYGTPAIFSDGGWVTVGDDGGNLFGVSVKAQDQAFPTIVFQPNIGPNNAIFGSPIVANHGSAGWANVFVGAEDQLMRVVTVDDTASVTATTEIRDGNNQPFPYRLRSQPAANNGRLYVLSGPVDIDSGQTRLFCFE